MSLDTLQCLAREGSPLLAEQLAAWDSRSERDATLHVRVAALAEGVGDLARAALEYNLALRDDATNTVALWRLALLRADEGNTERACRCLARLLELVPDEHPARVRLVELLLERGAYEAAGAQLERLPAEPRFEALRRRYEAVRAGAPQRTGLEPQRPPSVASPAALRSASRPEALAPMPTEQRPSSELEAPSAERCTAFVAVLDGREGVYARQWSSPTGKCGYSPVHAPFTPALARQHLLGDVTVGVYPLRHDGTVRWLVLDLDVRASELQRARGSAALERLLRRTHEAALALLDTCARHELHALLEDSGNKGRHLWLLFEQPVPAAAAKRLGEALVAATPPLPPELAVEVFPKQSRVPSDGLGNLVKLPLGLHRATGRRCALLDPGGAPLERPLTALLEHPRLGVEALRGALRALEAPASAPRAPGLRPGARAGTPDAATFAEPSPPPPGASLAPDDPPYALADDPQVQWLRARCPVVGELLHRAEASRVLGNEERAVVTYTLGHLERGAEAVNAVLDGVLNGTAAMRLKSPLRGHPMSCPKIRSRLPELTSRVRCDCRFEAVSSYPHPLLHVEALHARRRLETTPEALAPADLARLVLDWSKTTADAARLATLAGRLEQQLRAHVERHGAFDSAVGRLALVGGKLVLAANGVGERAPSDEPTRTADAGATHEARGR